MAAKRYLHEPAYVLHHYDWSESSVIVEAFTRNYGRTALIAKGAKRPSSNFRSVLLPLQPLKLSYTAEGEIGVLKSAEFSGGHVMPTGEPLLSGYYVNELMLRLVPRDDPQPELFNSYAVVVALLATAQAQEGDFLQAVLRAFELAILRHLGVLPELNLQTLTHQPLVADQRYMLVAETGLRLAQASEQRHAMLAQDCLDLQHALDADNALQQCLQLCLERRSLSQALKQQLRTVLHYHCAVPMLRTRQMIMELQQL